MDEDDLATVAEVIAFRVHTGGLVERVPFEVEEDGDGIHLILGGEALGSIPADPGARAARREELEERYDVSLAEPEALAEADPEQVQEWLFHAAGLADSMEPVIEWIESPYRSRLPQMAEIVSQAVARRLGSPFVAFEDAGSRLVRSLDFAIERHLEHHESSAGGVPTRIPHREIRLGVRCDLDWVDTRLLFSRVDGERREFTDDERGDARELVPPRLVERTAEALLIRWSEETMAEAGERIDACLEGYGEAFVSARPDDADRRAKSIVQAWRELSECIFVPHQRTRGLRTAYLRVEEEA